MNDNIKKLLQVLSDGEFHDGTSIGKQLGITRAAVWKMIKKCQKFGVAVQSVKGQGYRLQTAIELLQPRLIQSNLNHPVELTVLDCVDSTNEYLKTMTENNSAMHVCVAEMQTAGRGRLQRQWHSPFGENIYLSILYPMRKDVGQLAGLSLVVGLAICKSLQAACPAVADRIQVKWPNDVLADGNKLAGTLIEIQAESNGLSQVIVGVGLNVAMKAATEQDIDQSWASLSTLQVGSVSRNQLVSALANDLLIALQQFDRSGLGDFRQHWQRRDYLQGKQVTLQVGDKRVVGTCMGVDPQGNLLIAHQGGQVRAYSSGDATLAK